MINQGCCIHPSLCRYKCIHSDPPTHPPTLYSVVLMPTPRREIWSREGLLQPHIHFLPIKPDWSDLLKRIEECEADLPKCQAIAHQATLFMQVRSYPPCHPPTHLPTLPTPFISIHPSIHLPTHPPTHPPTQGFNDTQTTYKQAATRLRDYLDKITIEVLPE